MNEAAPKIRMRNKYPWAVASLGVVLACFALFYPGSEDQSLLNGSTMGTTWSVQLAEPLESNQSSVLLTEFQEELDSLELIFSNWKPESELSKLMAAEGKTLSVSPALYYVLQESKFIQRRSAGFFDITLAEVVKAWGFGDTEVTLPFTPPSRETQKHAIETTGMEYLYLLPENKVKLVKPLGLDLSAIAKGYIVDRMGQWLSNNGIDNFLLEIGGEILTSGQESQEHRWLLGIIDPTDVSSASTQFFASPLQSHRYVTIATSGTYYQTHQEDEKSYSHIIDPRTHQPIMHETISVSVIHHSNMFADAWATALLSAGKEVGIALANQNELMAQFISLETDGKLAIKNSKNMQEYLQTNKVEE